MFLLVVAVDINPRNVFAQNLYPTPPNVFNGPNSGVYTPGARGGGAWETQQRTQKYEANRRQMAEQLPRLDVAKICEFVGNRWGSDQVESCFQRQQSAYDRLRKYLGKIQNSVIDECSATIALANRLNPNINLVGYIGIEKCVRETVAEMNNDAQEKQKIENQVNQNRFRY